MERKESVRSEENSQFPVNVRVNAATKRSRFNDDDGDVRSKVTVTLKDTEIRVISNTIRKRGFEYAILRYGGRGGTTSSSTAATAATMTRNQWNESSRTSDQGQKPMKTAATEKKIVTTSLLRQKGNIWKIMATKEEGQEKIVDHSR